MTVFHQSAMRLKRLTYAAVTAGVMLAASMPAFGWGFWGHREITARAIELLPEELSGFFQKHRDYIVKHCVDPDLVQRRDSLEQYNHYIDIDHYGSYPFAGLPRNSDEAVAKFGADTLRVYGLMPWKIAEFTHRLSEAMRFGDEQAILHRAAYLAHYVEDAHVPLHTVLNYDGQFTNQHGLHSRFESDVPQRYAKDYQFDFPEQLLPIDDPLGFAFETILNSYSHAATILSADSLARAVIPPDKLTMIVEKEGKQGEYFERFSRGLGDLPRSRMEASIVDVARYWYTAWILAGKPALRFGRGG